MLRYREQGQEQKKSMQLLFQALFSDISSHTARDHTLFQYRNVQIDLVLRQNLDMCLQLYGDYNPRMSSNSCWTQLKKDEYSS
mmetsp:Transcript_17351/g.35783  ORF Transcript_17351/g.35783 Transcript_17351/m.35783 type:complete len:83 (+) Transcript_17351:274-522(+)